MARILVIDDDLALGADVARFLQSVGHDVTTARDGKEAIELFGEEALDLIVTDINMPEMDGIEVITIFRETRPGLPVLAVSGGGLFDKRMLLKNADALGAVGSLEKPFELDDLLAAVERALGGDAG